MIRRTGSWVAALAVAVTLVAGCGSDSGDKTAAPAPVVPSTTASAPTTEPEPSDPAGPSTAPSETAKPGKTPTKPTKPAKDDKLRKGAKGAEVTALQQRLTELGYWNGKADGKFGGTTQQAVYALQKAAGLGRDGVVGGKTRKALESGVRPKAKSSDGNVVEIDKKKQLLMLVKDGEVQLVFNTSTGSGERYETKDGGTAIASTPKGKFTVSRQIDGWRDAPLGMLWRPKYFNGGIAVHGANSIPPYAASHGCARLSISAMNYLWSNDKMPIKTKVWVY
ncbi:peptidoglycan-binding protein [Actinoplanes sp. NPDC089786]|uniref:peptidoglycan-binding protein n=1 Tax=Actinoplanes sp. NPDC089786 TaxID=3155185 RepID=UPI00341A07F3